MRATYDRIYRDLKAQIEDGTYGFGELLPSQAKLVAHYGVAHNTVRKAIAELANEGYCQPIHGKGVRVIWRPLHDRTLFVVGGIETFAEAATRNMLAATTRIEVFEEVTGDERIAELTGFAPGTQLLHVERIRVLDGKALIHDKNYFRAESVRGLTREQAEHSIYAYVEDVLGTRIVTSKRTITVERATPEDARWLDLGDCDFLAVIRGQTFDGNGMMFEYTQSRHHPDNFCFHDTAIRQRQEHLA